MTGGTITLPWPDKALSPNARKHYMAHSGAKKRAKRDGYYAAKASNVYPPADGRIPIELHFWPPTERRRDEDNLIARMKATLDGIAEALGVDDSRFRIAGVYIHRAQRPGRVEVRL